MMNTGDGDLDHSALIYALKMINHLETRRIQKKSFPLTIIKNK